MFKGSCLCGKVHFEITGNFQQFFLCHCHYCQKDTGSAHAANLFSTTARLNWTQGEELTRSYQVPNTRHIKRFCSHCGSAVPNIQMEGKLLVVPAGSLDDEISNIPNAHIFMSSKASWEKDLQQLPIYSTLPE